MEKGYKQINNNFFMNLTTYDLTGADFKVLIAIYRNTLFFGELEHQLSYSFIEKSLNHSVSHSQVVRSIKKLEKLDLIRVYKKNMYSKLNIQIRVLNFDKKGTQSWLPRVFNPEYKKVLKTEYQENIYKNIYKENKEEERASAQFSSENKEPEEEENDPGWWERFCAGEEDFEDE